MRVYVRSLLTHIRTILKIIIFYMMNKKTNMLRGVFFLILYSLTLIFLIYVFNIIFLMILKYFNTLYSLNTFIFLKTNNLRMTSNKYSKKLNWIIAFSHRQKSFSLRMQYHIFFKHVNKLMCGPVL